MVAVVSYNANEYIDVQSGLLNKYGTDKARARRAGEYSILADGRHMVEVTVALATLPTVASTNVKILDDTVLIPNGAFIEEVDVLVTKETAGANANFNLGLVDQDRTTQIDFDGFLAAADSFNAGTDLGGITNFSIYGYGSTNPTLTTEGGALIGTKITNTGLLVGWADTADFTAGVIKCRIYFSMPLTADL